MTFSQDCFNYCINPKCSDRQNPDYLDECRSCGMPLLINNRYRALKPLRECSDIYPTDIFEVQDDSLEKHHPEEIKVLKVLKHASPELVRLFQQEARSLIWLQHSGIPKVEPGGYFTISLPHSFKSLHCLVMEKILGQDLGMWVEQNGAIDTSKAADWLYQLTEILQKVHQHDLLHRDIKPTNIILQDSGKLSLIDFGIVSSLARGKTRVGTYGYMAPEQERGEATLASDFFALGRTMVHLLTANSPMNFNEERDTGNLIWRESAPQVEKWFADLVDDLMAFLPQNRPADASAILHRLECGDRAQDSFNSLPLISPNPNFPKTDPVNTELPSFNILSKIANLSGYNFNLVILNNFGSKFIGLLLIAIASWGLIKSQIAVFFNDRGVENSLAESLPNALYNYGLALMIDPSLASAHYNLAIKYEDLHKFNAAQLEYEKAMQGGFVPAFNNQARLYIKKGQYSEAVNLLFQGLKLAKNDKDKYALLKNLGWARLGQQRYAEAKVYLQQAIALFSDKASARCLLAEVLEAEGNKNSALLEWKNCLGNATYGNPDEDRWINMARQRLTAISGEQ